MTYKFAAGYNNEAGLITIEPQPACEGIKPGRVVESMDGSIFEDGFSYAELKYTALSGAQLDTLLTQFGLLSARSANCTISLPINEDRTFSNFNAKIQRINDPNYVKSIWEEAIFRIKIIEAL